MNAKYKILEDDETAKWVEKCWRLSLLTPFF